MNKVFDIIGNYNLLIKGPKDNTPKFNIYMMDSGKYVPFPLWDTIDKIFPKLLA